MSNQSQSSSSVKSSSMLTGSMSALSGTMDEENRSEQRNESFIFPLMSEIAHTVRIPSFIYIVQFLLQCIQSIGAHLFIGNNHIWDSISNTSQSLRIISYFVNLGVIDTMNENNQGGSHDFITVDDFYNCLVQYIILVIFIVVEIAFTLFLYFWYRKKRTFLKWSLYISEIFFSIINQLLFVPACAFAGYASWQIDSSNSTSSIVFLFISLIPAILFFAIWLFNNRLMAISVYIPRSILACWDSRILTYQVLFLGLAAFLAPCTNPFPDWFIYVAIIVCILGSASLFYYSYFLPMINHFVTSLIQGFAVLSIVSSVLAIIYSFADIPEYVGIIIPIVACIIAIVAFYFVNNFRLKNILTKLTLPEEIKNEKEKHDFFETLDIKSDVQAIFYIRIGIGHISPVCTDFSLMKFAVETRPNLNVLFPVLQITSMFPCQTQFFSYLSAIVHRSTALLNIYQNFLLYQVRKVQVIRQSSVSKEAQSENKILFKMSEETISLVRGFWGEIGHLKGNVSTASLRYIRNATNKTTSAYLDAIDQFPKSQEIADNYVRFLIEAVGDYKGSVQQTRNLQLIEQNRKIITDSAFRSFANTFPEYLTEKVLDTHGMYIINQDDMNNQGEASYNMSTRNQSSTSNQSTSSNDEFDDIASRIFKHSKLRLALQDVFDNASMPSLTGLRILSVVSAVMVVIFLIIMMDVMGQSSDTAFEMIETCIFSARVVTNVEYLGLISTTRVLEFSSHTSNLGISLAYLLSIMPEDLPQQPSAFTDCYAALNAKCFSVRQYVNENFEIMYSNPSYHIGEIEEFNGFDLEKSYPAVFYGSVSLQSLRGAIYLFLNQIEQISAKQQDPLTMEYPTDILPFMYALNNAYMISLSFDKMFYNETQGGINQCNETTQTFKIIAYIMCILFVIILFVLRLVNFVFVIRNCNKWSDILKSVTKSDIQESSKPIYLRHLHKLPTGTVHSAHDASLETVLLPTIFICTAGISIFSVLYIAMKTETFFDEFEEEFEWAYNCQQLFSKTLGLILAMFIDYTQPNNLPYQLNQSIGENLTRNIDILSQYQSYLDLSIIGKNHDFDTFYYVNNNKHDPAVYNYAKFLDCTSMSNKMNIAINFFHQMRDQFQGDATATFTTTQFAGLALIADKYLSESIDEFLSYMIQYATSIKEEHNSDIQQVCVIVIVIVIVLWAIETILISMLYHSFSGFKQLIRALPPLAICQNRKIMAFLSGQSESQKNQDTTEVDTLFNSSENALVTIDNKLIIQTSNPTFTKMTGIQPDAILGQSISFLFPIPEDENGNIRIEESAFYSAMNEIRNVQGNSSNPDIKLINTKLRAKNDENLRVRVTLIPYYSTVGQFESLVIVIKNTEEITELKNKLDEEKTKTNKLIQSLVPNGALSSVKGKKHSVFFKADKATVISIEIVGISECVATMTPKDLLKVLEQIFQLFDDAISRYNSISMMRTENDMIYAVSGLFNNVGNFEKQANDTAGFLLEILQRIEDLNIQTSTDFHLRTAAHVGGPITGFIISPDTPYFEMLTTCIKYTSQMQDKGQTDQAQLTQSVVDYLDKSTFIAENKYQIKSADGGKENVYSVTYQENKQPSLQPIQQPNQPPSNNQPPVNTQPVNNGKFVPQDNEKDGQQLPSNEKDLFTMKTVDSD